MTLNQAILSATTLSVSAAEVTIPVPSGYTDLRLVISARLSTSTNVGGLIKMNGVNSNSPMALFGTGTSTSSEVNNLTGLHNSSSYTANTFSNSEIYVPNYLSNVNKYYSYNGTTENNAASSYMGIAVGVVPTTSPVTSITVVAAGDSYVAGSSFTLYGITKLGVTPTLTPKATGGDIVKNDGTYWYHAFLSTGAFIPQTTLTADVLVVAGGGGASNNIGGGGGAGGYRTSTLSLSATSYTCTVGAGGVGGGGNNIQVNGTKGGNSSLSAITSTGGGYGAIGDVNGGAGGSGGGTRATTASGGTGNEGGYSPVEGYAGANGTQSYLSGGGGGATQAGAQGTNSVGGTGGSGSSSCSSWGLATGTGHNVSGTVYYAGGGGSAGYQTNPAGAGGSGGGGAGAVTSNASGTAGTVNTGGGGGGGAAVSGTNYGGNGGSGIVIIRYAMA